MGKTFRTNRMNDLTRPIYKGDKRHKRRSRAQSKTIERQWFIDSIDRDDRSYNIPETSISYKPYKRSHRKGYRQKIWIVKNKRIGHFGRIFPPFPLGHVKLSHITCETPDKTIRYDWHCNGEKGYFQYTLPGTRTNEIIEQRKLDEIEKFIDEIESKEKCKFIHFDNVKKIKYYIEIYCMFNDAKIEDDDLRTIKNMYQPIIRHLGRNKSRV